MGFVIHAEMMWEATPQSPYILRHPWLQRLLRFVSWLLIPAAYLGLLLAPIVVFGLPLNLCYLFDAPALVWVITSIIVGLLLLGALLATGLVAVLSLRIRIIELDAIVCFCGTAIAGVILPFVFLSDPYCPV